MQQEVIDTRPNEQDTDNKKKRMRNRTVQIEVLLHAENVYLEGIDPVLS